MPALIPAAAENWSGNGITGETISDAAKRAADIVNAYVTFTDRDELRGKWVAIKLVDGSHDGTLYDSKRDAVKHQLDEFLCAYVSFRNIHQRVSVRDMEVFMRFSRDAYDAGFRLPDPDSQTGGPSALITTAQTDYYRNQMRAEFWAANEHMWQKWLEAAKRGN